MHPITFFYQTKIKARYTRYETMGYLKLKTYINYKFLKTDRVHLLCIISTTLFFEQYFFCIFSNKIRKSLKTPSTSREKKNKCLDCSSVYKTIVC